MVTQGKAARSARGRFARKTTTPATTSTPKKQSTLNFRPLAASDGVPDGDVDPIIPPSQPIDANISAGRPPSKLAVKQPYGAVQQTIDGVTTTLKIASDENLSAADVSLLGINPTPKPATEQPKEKRVLRSKDGPSRTRSDLAHFFPDYEEVVFGKPKEPDFITADSTLYIIDKKLKPQDTITLDSGPSTNLIEDAPTSVHANESPVKSHLETVQESEQEDGLQESQLESTETRADEFTEDPLSEYYYLIAHRRGERREKNLRNIEKEHAMHEKGELERIFEELKGPDWVKTMGLTGVIDIEKRGFEKKRDYYIDAIQALLDKFRAWRAQEKELKARKDAALAARQEEDDYGPAGVDASHLNHSTLDDTELSALQLRQEAGLPPRTPGKKIRLRLNFVLPEEDPSKPFVSFCSKPHLRTAALATHRRGRNSTAFGQPVPEIAEREFALPDGYITEEIVTANARKRRRLKRESKG